MWRLSSPRAKSGVPDFAIRIAEAGNTPLRAGEAEWRSHRVRAKIVKQGARTLTRLRASRGLGLSPRGRGGADLWRSCSFRCFAGAKPVGSAPLRGLFGG